MLGTWNPVIAARRALRKLESEYERKWRNVPAPQPGDTSYEAYCDLSRRIQAAKARVDAAGARRSAADMQRGCCVRSGILTATRRRGQREGSH